MATAIRYGQRPKPPPGVFQPRPDNLSTMLFVAALFHSVLILGITFTAGDPAGPAAEATSVDVILLAREYEKRPDSEDAEYLAQQNLVGAGNTTEDELRVAYGRNSDPVMPGPEREGVDEQPQAELGQQQSERLVFAQTPDSGTLTRHEQQDAAQLMPVRTGMPGATNSVEILATPDTETVLKGAQPRQLVVSASTRESRIASYLDGWKRRIERVGTMNFPRDVLNQPATRNPVLQVTIAASGKLTEVIILTSSGNRQLDMAAVDILRLSSPFDTFPEYLQNDYDSLKFSYEWRFSGSRVGRIQVP
jgi:protein TonB